MNFYSPSAPLISPALALSNLSVVQPGAVLQPTGRQAPSITRSFLFSKGSFPVSLLTHKLAEIPQWFSEKTQYSFEMSQHYVESSQ